MNLLCWNMAPNTRVTRKWEIFAGRNKFFCDGYLMTAPHSGVFYLTVFLITGTSALFFAFDCPFLAEKLTPAIPIIGGILYIFTMSSLFRTSFTDPGIIPRASQDEAAYIEKQIEVPNSLNSPTYRPPPRTKEVLVRGQTVKLKYCFTCKIFRPPRASHCSLCDNCVDRFDHHCPWVGNCVGKRNYRFFYMFIVSLAFLTVFIFTCSTIHIVLLTKDDNDVSLGAIKKAPFSVIIAIICFLSVWSVFGLAGFHTYLTTSDQTTNEDIKGSFSSKGGQQATNPYSKGNICLNCFHILCGPITPSLIDRRGVVTDEYRIQMQGSDPATRYNIQSPPLIVQPAGNNDAIIKSNIYDMDIEATPVNSGVYRQRSYDNLHNGNSNSVTHLVENEIPLAIINSPLEVTNGNGGGGGVIVDDDANIAESIGNQNNLSGSYNNLFTDKLDDDIDNIERMNKSSNNKMMVPNEISENVYSNVPTSGNIISSSSNNTIVTMDDDNTSDPNLHVYSNITSTTSLSNLNELNYDINNLSCNLINNESLMASSTLLNDDLDLDDPVIAASAFGKTKNVNNHNHQNQKQQKSMSLIKKSTSNHKNDLTTLSSSLPLNQHHSQLATNAITQTTIVTSTPQKSTAFSTTTNNEMKNVILPAVAILDPSSVAGTTAVTTNTVTPLAGTNNSSISNNINSNNNNSSTTSAFISPSRLRLLHDTTMIDTALDLDSLDGSSIGNSSQACLVKTAIV